MSEKKKKDPLHPETFFLPPLKMILTFFDKEARQREKEKNAARTEDQEKATEKDVEKLIEKLSEKDE
ncbi:MAG TPA: hypothetical protein VKB04_10640 [Anaerolineales bacterium]|nr:hypothetical protein [Anaerolineales bacterium]